MTVSATGNSRTRDLAAAAERARARSQQTLGALGGTSTFTPPPSRTLNNARVDGFTPATNGLVELNPPPAGSNRDAAISKARELLEGPAVERVDASTGSIVVSDPAEANSGTDLSGPRATEALQQLADNTQLEGVALGALAPEAREQYLEVKGELMADPVAALGLQTMLLEGTLDDGKTLGALSSLSTQELAPGIDRPQLMSDVVQELATPESIAQRNRGTCAATSVEIDLAKRNPAEYVRLISGLASPEGTVTTAGGDTLKREDGVLTDTTGRTLSQRLLAPALMELANGDGSYDNTMGASLYPDGHKVGGLYPGQADRILESVNGSSYDFVLGSKAGMAKMREELAAGRDALVSLDWGSGGHKVIATGLETRDGVEYVRVTNPWGREELIPSSAFEARLNDVHFPS